jgi:phosphoadenosine phosphosulfate reductase
MEKVANHAEYCKKPIEDKISLSKKILADAINEFKIDKTLLAWTGGKDSTLILWMLLELQAEKKIQMPDCLFINEGCVFDEILGFVKKIEKEHKLNVYHAINKNVFDLAKGKPGNIVRVKDLNERNRSELEKIKFAKNKFEFDPESFEGNHLMKTVALNMFLESNDYACMITGIRWDEQDARKDETAFSPRKDPDHIRIHPILHFDERDVWEAHFKMGVPYCNLYKKGYRSLGAAGTTTKTSDLPAWKQDLESTTERSGRKQDKENLMEKLRDLGYM